MATAANWQQEGESVREVSRVVWRESTDQYRLRAIPNEDVYFYAKRVDNSRLVRPVNRAARRQEIRVMGGAFVMLLLVVGLAMPHVLNLMAGAQIQKLRADRDSLIAEHEELAVREAEAMDPARMKAIAKNLEMVELKANQVHHLNPPRKPETLEAKLKP